MADSYRRICKASTSAFNVTSHLGGPGVEPQASPQCDTDQAPTSSARIATLQSLQLKASRQLKPTAVASAEYWAAQHEHDTNHRSQSHSSLPAPPSAESRRLVRRARDDNAKVPWLGSRAVLKLWGLRTRPETGPNRRGSRPLKKFLRAPKYALPWKASPTPIDLSNCGMPTTSKRPLTGKQELPRFLCRF